MSGEDLCNAAWDGKVDVVQKLVEKGKVDVNYTNQYGDTALHRAAGSKKTGAVDVVRYLLTQQASADAVNKHGSTPLMEAAFNARLGACSALVEDGASVDARNADGETPLFLAAMLGHVDVVTFLWSEGADKSIGNAAGALPVDAARKHKRDAMVKLLMQKECPDAPEKSRAGTYSFADAAEEHSD
jgi:ankyrin repeat protein